MTEITSDKQCILVTGAASGIGRATALLFAKKGWYVGLYDVDDRGLETAASEIGPGCCYRPMDVSSAASVRDGIAHFSRNTGGRMDALFNNAGIIRMGLFDDISLEDQLRVIDVNLKGVMNCTYAALKMLKATKNSHVINMSSTSSIYGIAYLSAYSATKAAVSSLTESLAMEFGRNGIIVSDLRVPFVKTPLLEGEVRAPSIDTLGVHLTPEDIAVKVWKAAHGSRVHNDTMMMKFFLLLRFLPPIMKKIVLRLLVMPRGKN